MKRECTETIRPFDDDAVVIATNRIRADAAARSGKLRKTFAHVQCAETADRK
jgi:hypothetical protein